tara:strand:+ start:60 stop:530 length:471 start_codon:yes stop_codon:yes gene_type:complete
MALTARDLINKRLTVTPSAGAYADHDQIGSGVNTITDVFASASRKGIIESISVHDYTTQAAALTVHFFRSSPTNAVADNAQLGIADADMASDWVGKVELPAANYQSVVTGAVCTVSNINLIVDSTDDNLYVLIESAGTPTYGASAALTFIIGLSRG